MSLGRRENRDHKSDRICEKNLLVLGKRRRKGGGDIRRRIGERTHLVTSTTEEEEMGRLGSAGGDTYPKRLKGVWGEQAMSANLEMVTKEGSPFTV